MTCKHCGNDLPKNAKYCPNCSEPTDIDKEFLENTPKENLSNALTKRFLKGAVIVLILAIAFSFVITFSINNALSGFFGYFISLFSFGLIFVVIDMMNIRNNENKVNILIQFEKNKTSICPMCGSHSVKIYRKGYNYNEAFWGSVFNVKGSRYIAGMNSNDAMCYCQHCGHKWNSGYDYRITK